MATLYDNFSANSVGDVPAGLTSRWETAAAGNEVKFATDPELGEKEFFIYGSNGYDRVVYEATGIVGSANDEIYVLLANIQPFAEHIQTLVLRGSGTYATRSGYVLFIRAGSESPELSIRRKSGGATSTAATSYVPPGTISAGAVRVKLSVKDDGANVRVKAWLWPNGTEQPVTPSIEYVDTNPLPIGWAGIGSVSNGVTGKAAEFGFYSVGTDGDAAPEPDGPELPVALTATALGITTAVLDWRDGV